MNQKFIRIAAAVITAIVLFAALRRWMARPPEAEQTLAAIPAVEAIKDADPAEYAALKEEVRQAIKSGAGPAEVQGRVYAAVAVIARKYVPRASDAALRQYVAVSVDQMERLSAKDPVKAAAVLLPKPGQAVDVGQDFNDATIKEELAAFLEVIRSGAASEGSFSDSDAQRADELLTNIMMSFAHKYGDDLQMISNPSTADPQKFCTMMVDLYRTILALPEHDSAIVLRKLLSR